MSAEYPHERKHDALRGPVCTSVKVTFERGLVHCTRPHGHVNEHQSPDGQTWT